MGVLEIEHLEGPVCDKRNRCGCFPVIIFPARNGNIVGSLKRIYPVLEAKSKTL